MVNPGWLGLIRIPQDAECVHDDKNCGALLKEVKDGPGSARIVKDCPRC